MRIEQFESVFQTNTFGPYYLSRALMRSWLSLPLAVSPDSEPNVPAIEEQGPKKKDLRGKQLLFVSSISGLVAMNPQYQAAYNASKAGVTMLAKVSLEACCQRERLELNKKFVTESGRRMGSIRSGRQLHLSCMSCTCHLRHFTYH